MYSPSIQKLIEIFSKFPTVGPRTATRFVFYLMTMKKEEVDETINAISKLKINVKICSFCFNPFEPAPGALSEKLCPICSNPSRNKTLLCIVEKEIDLSAIEKIKKYQGLYFILGGTVASLKKEALERLRIKELVKRLKEHPEIQEIIIATNPTAEGQTTALYVERVLKPINTKITRLGRGLPLGGELEYADEETLSFALEGRK